MILYQTVLLLLLLIGSALCEDDQDDPCKKSSISVTERLRNHLFCSFKHKGPPTDGMDIPDLYENKVTVQITLHLAFIKLEIEKSRLLLNNWLELGFYSEHAKWNPKDFDSLTKIDFEGDKIWLPDINIYNKNDLSKTPKAVGSARCIASYDGQIQCVSPSQHDGLCFSDLTWYPFDVQTCDIEYGSWIHSGAEMNVTLSDPPITYDMFVPSPQWELVKAIAIRDPGMFDGESFPHLKYVFNLRRHSRIYHATIIAPAIALMLITLTILLMDFQSSDRVNIAAFNLVCNFLYIQNLYWQIPVSGSRPEVVKLFRNLTLSCAILIVLTIIIKKIAQNKTTTPKYINWITSSYVGQRIGTFKYSVQIAATRNEDDEEGTTIVNIKEQEKYENWILFAVLLNRITTAVYCIMYLMMIFIYIP